MEIRHPQMIVSLPGSRPTPPRRRSCPAWTSTHTAPTSSCCPRPSPLCVRQNTTSKSLLLVTDTHISSSERTRAWPSPAVRVHVHRRKLSLSVCVSSLFRCLSLGLWAGGWTCDHGALPLSHGGTCFNCKPFQLKSVSYSFFVPSSVLVFLSWPAQAWPRCLPVDWKGFTLTLKSRFCLR